MLWILAAVFFGEAAPVEMPRAEAYLVKDAGNWRLEDRYNVFDLWSARSELGTWFDEEGRIFHLSCLDLEPPENPAVVTRERYYDQCVSLKKKDELKRFEAIKLLSPTNICSVPLKPRHRIRGYEEILLYHDVYTPHVICAFLPEKADTWYFARWDLLESDSYSSKYAEFEEEFLEKHKYRELRTFNSPIVEIPKIERELLRYDAGHTITNYPAWHFTGAKEFVILDNLVNQSAFIAALTNDIPKMQAKFAKIMPTPLDGTNTLCVARIFAHREEYLACGGEELKNTAAYWSPLRREIVAYLPFEGSAKLLRTFRHEAFHQYLSYATAMISASPWLNEGYAEYFENEKPRDMKALGDIKNLAQMLPLVLMMDYEEFYSGTPEEVSLKYDLAWSVAYFIEHGAGKVRFEPFKDLKTRYISALLETHDMIKATAMAFGNKDNLKKFVEEWLKYYLDPVYEAPLS